MSNAFVYFNDEPTPRLMSDGQILDYVRTHPGTTYRCECEECRQPIVLNDKDASATSFRPVDVEILRDRQSAGRSPYSHTAPHNNNVSCSRYRPNDPRYANRDRSGEGTRKRREDAEKTITGMANVLADLDEGLYFEMTGQSGIPPKVRKTLISIGNRLLNKPGLSQRQYAFWHSYMKFAELPPQPRPFPDGVRMVVFKPQGQVREMVERRHSRRRTEMAIIPTALVLHYADPDGLVFDPEPISCRVTGQAAHDLILGARERRRNPPAYAAQPVMQSAALQAIRMINDTPHSLTVKASRPGKSRGSLLPDRAALL